MHKIHLNVLILGGGATGLWLLDRLRREGRSVLLAESSALGNGQTIAAQGILHSGLKYSLQGLLTASAREAREMPAQWRRCLEGNAAPNLSRTEVRSQSFYLWGTNSAASKIGMLGARLGLQVTPQAVSPHNAPSVLKGGPGAIFRVDEQVISCGSLLANLAAVHLNQIVQTSDETAPHLRRDGSGRITSVVLTSPSGQQVEVHADWVVFAAGKGNAALRTAAGLPSQKQQLRPLHMVMLRGSLPEFYGHCVDGAKTRVSITSARTASGEMVWQVGGQISEEGVDMDCDTLLAAAKQELTATVPNMAFDRVEWSTYRVDRAEGATLTGGRPDSFRLEREGNILTAWPTKLVLVPQLISALSEAIRETPLRVSEGTEHLADWPTPPVAQAPWDRPQKWTYLDVPLSAKAA